MGLSTHHEIEHHQTVDVQGVGNLFYLSTLHKAVGSRCLSATDLRNPVCQQAAPYDLGRSAYSRSIWRENATRLFKHKVRVNRDQKSASSKSNTEVGLIPSRFTFTLSSLPNQPITLINFIKIECCFLSNKPTLHEKKHSLKLYFIKFT